MSLVARPISQVSAIEKSNPKDQRKEASPPLPTPDEMAKARTG